MIPRCLRACVELLLGLAVMFIFAFSPSSMTQCETKDIRNLDIKLCQLQCFHNYLCWNFEYNVETLTCRLSTSDSKQTWKQVYPRSLLRNLSYVPTGDCASWKCSLGQRCVEIRSGKALCEQASTDEMNYLDRQPRNEEAKQETFAKSRLHEACKNGILSRVRRILSRSSVDVNKRDKKYGRTPLMVAAQKGHRRIFEFLIRKGANASQVDDSGNNVLHWACTGGQIGMVKYVLKRVRSGINSRGKHGATPLSMSAFKGHRDVFEFLVSKGATVTLVDDYGYNILHWACRGGHVSMVKHLFSQYNVDINSRTKTGNTPVMVAAHNGYRDVCVFLVSMGANVSQVNDDGNNVLHLACRGGHVRMVKHLLLQYSVDINSRTNLGKTPLMVAVHNGHIDLFAFLVSKEANLSHVDDYGNNVLYWACKGGHVGMVKYVLLRCSVDINSRSKMGKTPLMTTVCNGHRAVFELLMSKGATVTRVDDYGYSILHWACRGGHASMVKYVLLQGSIDINSRTHAGTTPVMTAVQYGHKDVATLLVSKDANVTQVDDNGYNILHWACRGGYVSMVKYVLSQCSIDINSRTHTGATPVMIAVIYGHKDVATLLVSKDANVTHVDDDGNNILHWACRGKDVGLLNYIIIKCNIDANSRGKYGKTPLMKAAYCGHREVFDVLLSMGANVSHVDDDGDNILHRASVGGHVKMVQHILSHDMVKINSRGKYGRTSLMRAAYFGNRKVFDLLVKKGSRNVLVDDYGDNILHLASLGGRVEIVKHILSQHMVDIVARDNVGKTAAMIAKQEGHSEVFKLLVSSGCPVE